MSTSPTPAFAIGPDEDPDKYRLRRQIGGGGEAELWEGEFDVGGGLERVAVKILRPEHAEDVAYWRDRWSEQVDLLRLVRHPGVVGVHAQFDGARMHLPGAAGESEIRALYLVMNWVEGPDLRDWVTSRTEPAHRVEGMRLLMQIADTLDYLHGDQATPSGRPVVHGDLSPANVIVDQRGQTVLVDFGLVRIARHVTAVGRGTLGYAAPEVIHGGEYSPASDRYAFAGLTYYVMTGTHPPADPAERRAGLERIASDAGGQVPVEELAAAFAVDPDQRPRAGEWIRQLRVQTSTAPVRTSAESPPAPTTAAATVPIPSPASRAVGSLLTGRRPWASAGLAAALVAAVAIVALIASSYVGRTPENGPGAGGAPPTETVTATATSTVTATSERTITTPPTASPDRASPSEPEAETPRIDPAALPENWPGYPEGTPFQSGTADLSSRAGDFIHHDLDRNVSERFYHRLDDDDDVSSFEDGLGAQNGTEFARWTGRGNPSLKDCSDLARKHWTAFIGRENFESRTVFCVRSSARRYGFMITQASENRYLHIFSYQLWERSGD